MKNKRLTRRELDELYVLRIRHGATIGPDRDGGPGFVLMFASGFKDHGTRRLRGAGGSSTARHALEILRTL